MRVCGCNITTHDNYMTSLPIIGPSLLPLFKRGLIYNSHLTQQEFSHFSEYMLLSHLYQLDVPIDVQYFLSASHFPLIFVSSVSSSLQAVSSPLG